MRSLIEDSDALRRIGSSTLVFATGGAITGASIALIRNESIPRFTFSTALNCTIVSLTFCTTRESFLAYQQSHNPEFGLKDSQTRDWDELLSSAIAGGVTGSLLNTLVRGPRGAIPGLVGFGILCSAGQFAFTKARHFRQSMILDKEKHDVIRKGPSGLSGWKVEMPSWSPLRKISDQEHAKIIDEEIFKVDWQIRDVQAQIDALEKTPPT